MCSRFSRVSLVKALQQRFLFEDSDLVVAAEYNIAPTDSAFVIVQEGEKRFLKRMMFGLIPHWAKDPKFGLHCLNARAETVAEKPAFRDSFKKRRCLVITDGFYEWKREGKEKTPFRIVLKDHAPFGLAGLWDTWKRPDGRAFETFSIITTGPNELMGTIHDRMPVIMNQENESLWLAPYVTETKTLLPLLKPFPSELMEMIPVSKMVNSSRNKSEECIQRVV